LTPEIVNVLLTAGDGQPMTFVGGGRAAAPFGSLSMLQATTKPPAVA
jgi:hypothetical protein